MDSLINAYHNNNQYKIHHIHLTFGSNSDINIDEILKKNEFTVILLPYKDKLYKQTLTTIKVMTDEQFNKYMNILRPFKDHVIGFKLEGILFDQKIEEINDFVYYEIHTKSDDLDVYKDGKDLLSFSLKNDKFMSAERIYEKESIPGLPKIEVCYYEDWIDDIEIPWKKSVITHYDILKEYIFI